MPPLPKHTRQVPLPLQIVHKPRPLQAKHIFSKSLLFEMPLPEEELPEEELPEELLSVEGAGLSASFPPLPPHWEHVPFPLHIEHFFPYCTLPPLQYGHTPEALQ